MSKSRVWLFRFLIVAATGLFIVTWFLPWWHAEVHVTQINNVWIYPWGLVQQLEPDAEGMVAGVSQLPFWMLPLLWAYFAIVIVTLLSSLFIGDKEVKLSKYQFNLGKLMIGIAGFSLIAVAVIMVVYTSMRLEGLGEFAIPLQGERVFHGGYLVGMRSESGLQPAYYIAHGVGLLLIALAFLRTKIIGKPKSN